LLELDKFIVAFLPEQQQIIDEAREVLREDSDQFPEPSFPFIKELGERQAGTPWETVKQKESAETEADVMAARGIETKLPMNPAVNFEPGFVTSSLSNAQLDLLWVEKDIIYYELSRSEPWTFTLFYTDGKKLVIPLETISFRSFPEDTTITVFRRHKETGRLIPFQISIRDFKNQPF
jgi:hypothetical protein